MKIKVGLVDDHQLFLKSLSLMLQTLDNFDVVVEALNGKDLAIKLNTLIDKPDIMLIDVNMPHMDGVETTVFLQENYPATRLVALSMNDNDHAIIQMFKAGCCAYLLKDMHPIVLEKALKDIHELGYFNADSGQINPARLLRKAAARQSNVSPKEKIFLGYACSDMTYKQIASCMNVSERTVDGYRESLFEKFGVQSRVGLCLEALRKGFVSL